jgi:hypothetical protein
MYSRTPVYETPRIKTTQTTTESKTMTAETADRDLAEALSQLDDARRAHGELATRQRTAREKLAALTEAQKRSAHEIAARQNVVVRSRGCSAPEAAPSDFGGEIETTRGELDIATKALMLQDEAIRQIGDDIAAAVRPGYAAAVAGVCEALLALQAALVARDEFVQQIYVRGLVGSLPAFRDLPHALREQIRITGGQYVEQAMQNGFFNPGDAGARP